MKNRWANGDSLVVMLALAGTSQEAPTSKHSVGGGSMSHRTSFNAYENMPFYFKLGFAFGFFEKNTVFIVDRK